MKPILDISEWQENITYSLTARDISACIIRAGWTGVGSNHGTYTDELFETHYKGFTGQSVPVGVYWYAGAVNDEGVQRELDHLAGLLEGKTISLPVFYDLECPKGEHRSLSRAERTRLAVLWCDAVRKMGYTPGIYASCSYAETALDMAQFSDDTVIWIAQYYSELEYNSRVEVWQYTSSGAVQGIRGNVDLSNSLTGEAFWGNGQITKAEETTETKEANGTTEAKEAVTTEESIGVTRIKEAQAWLNGYIGAGLDVDGKYGPLTTQANIKALQHYCGAVEDGIFGDETRSKCLVAERDDDTDLVSILQCALSRWGYTTVEVDGIFGPITLKAVKAFQKKHGLTLDGKAGKNTFEALLA